MGKVKNNEIAAIGFEAAEGLDILSEALADEYAGMDFGFDRVKIPAGGGTAFEIPGEDGEETEMVKEITGVILFSHPAYAYYSGRYVGGNHPPQCGSYDGITGIGNPGGECRKCLYNQFGSGDGQGKACKNKRQLYILQEGEMFPIILSLPSGSLRAFQQYAKRQLSKRRFLHQIVTKITLKKATNADGISFSQTVFQLERPLTDTEIGALAGITERVRDYAANLTPAAHLGLPPEMDIDSETGEVVEPLA